MRWPWSTPDVDLRNLNGLEAVEYFNKAELAQRYHYLTSIFRRGNDTSPAARDVSLLYLPEPRCVSLPLFPKKSYYSGRNNFLRQSLLTATLFVQRPLTEDETSAVTHWSARDYNSLTFSTIFLLTGFVFFGPTNVIRKGLTPLWKRLNVMKDLWLTNITEKHALQDQRRGSILLAGFSLFVVYRSFWRQKEMEDVRLKAIRAAEREQKPRWPEARYSLWAYGWRGTLIGARTIKRLSFWDMDDDDRRKLRYEVSAFVDPPPGVASDVEEQPLN
ncbi:hypothetical protein MMC10_010614 [Thelotrema lepadinum]|nr:hypothetical protein [Thelotrema lepadinum]